jgi:hypothetical protein
MRTDQSTTVNECKVPAYWAINYQAKDAHNAAPPNLGAKIEYKIDSTGFCSTFTTVGGAVAGESLRKMPIRINIDMCI